jgi:hypothetical protein
VQVVLAAYVVVAWREDEDDPAGLRASSAAAEGANRRPKGKTARGKGARNGKKRK